jgi:hypothetical protein
MGGCCWAENSGQVLQDIDICDIVICSSVPKLTSTVHDMLKLDPVHNNSELDEQANCCLTLHVRAQIPAAYPDTPMTLVTTKFRALEPKQIRTSYQLNT